LAADKILDRSKIKLLNPDCAVIVNIIAIPANRKLK
jgi:hypothetical protein